LLISNAGDYSSAEKDEFIEQIAHAGNQIDKSLESILNLNWARANMRKMQAKPQNTNLSEISAQLISILASLFQKKNQKITMEIDGKVMVCISDNGVGISNENQKKLFRLDEKISTPGTSNEKGTGLGLLLCKEFIGKNNGEIWVESQINQGTSLPVTKA
jgi:signal transduction histidine kinase